MCVCVWLARISPGPFLRWQLPDSARAQKRPLRAESALSAGERERVPFEGQPSGSSPIPREEEATQGGRYTSNPLSVSGKVTSKVRKEEEACVCVYLREILERWGLKTQVTGTGLKARFVNNEYKKSGLCI